MGIVIKNSYEIKLMRESGRLAQGILNRLGQHVKAGISSQQIDDLARDWIEESGAKSPFYGYRGKHEKPFPGIICTSVNEAVVHGVPTPKPLQDGDIISLDVGVLHNGWIGDTAGTFAVGKLAPATERLLRVTKEALFLGIAQAKVGNHVGDISYAIQTYCEAHGYAIVRDLVGHGVGRSLHEEPSVPNFGKKGKGPKLRPGMTIAIEPMVNMGSEEVLCLNDGWTCVAADGQPSAHYEHTVVILSDGPEILTMDE